MTSAARIPDLTPTHLLPGTEEDAREKAAAAQAPKEPPDARKKAMREREYTWRFTHVDSHGRTYEGQFKNKILNVRDTMTRGIQIATLGGGIPYETLDSWTAEMNTMVAHLMVSLDPGTRPDWAKDLLAISDDRIIRALYKEVEAHEATFRGPDLAA